MKATSFINLVRRHGIARIEIPIIQRDYAQGRRTRDAARIRGAFLKVLREALADGHLVHLDFIYGHIDDGKLVPLDGQQRLTALFLLHWYLAARAGVPIGQTRLPALTYETRQSSRRFCELLVAQRPFPLSEGPGLSGWIRDQHWFASAWRHDPTIDSMLVVLDEVHTLFQGTDCAAAWRRLVDADHPAITFDFLSIEKLGLTEDLYIKMNSRGKPLTRFEHFKAELEAMVREAAPERHDELCSKIDNQWSDIFWKLRGYEKAIDDLFLRYFRFVTDALGTWDMLALADDDLHRARAVYASSKNRLAFLFEAFDVWHGKDTGAWFDGVFTRADHAPSKVALFDDVDLLRACSRSYTDGRSGPNRAFPLWKVLLLFAVVQHLRTHSNELPERLRVLRNLAFNSENEVRQAELPTLLNEVSLLVTTGAAPARGFNRRQVTEEEQKRKFLAKHLALAPPLRRLEDHPLLQGCLVSFDLDAVEFARRAAVFDEIFPRDIELVGPEVNAALLACGDYSQQNSARRHQFGTERQEVWRDLLTKGAANTKAALKTLLDAVGAPGSGAIRDRLRSVTQRYLAAQEAEPAFDWRYYLVKYDEMRTGDSGIYAGSEGPMSFRLCMLRRKQMNSNYRDPFLFAIYLRSGADQDDAVLDPWFTSYAYFERWLELGRDGVAIRCAEKGFVLRVPTDGAYAAALRRVASSYRMEADGLVRVPQAARGGVMVDTEDRVLLGVRLVKDLLAMKPA
ncbi:DUF262 domain-containing protein [Sorangium sp. So ce367]|uniref:GmrSD restriction endonuclease domain-containing protein n=1 Tax=Sorangium sp. So ce367 TaxID=3133305 RepID=UPI003F616638